jgi:hypothetical protein
MIPQENDAQFRQTLGERFLEGHLALYAQIAYEISLHYLLPEIKAFHERQEKVWAEQVVLTYNQLIAVRINQDVSGKVQFGNYWLSPSSKLVYNLKQINDFEPIEQEREYAHVVTFLDEKLKAQTLYYNLKALLPPLPKEDITFTMKPCHSCGKPFELEKRRPTQRYCSTKCREKEKKRKYREKKSQKSRATGELSTVSTADTVDNLR